MRMSIGIGPVRISSGGGRRRQSSKRYKEAPVITAIVITLMSWVFISLAAQSWWIGAGLVLGCYALIAVVVVPIVLRNRRIDAAARARRAATPVRLDKTK